MLVVGREEGRQDLLGQPAERSPQVCFGLEQVQGRTKGTRWWNDERVGINPGPHR
jgi:hypothetical protein